MVVGVFDGEEVEVCGLEDVEGHGVASDGSVVKQAWCVGWDGMTFVAI